jgi:hypothetical protein
MPPSKAVMTIFTPTTIPEPAHNKQQQPRKSKSFAKNVKVMVMMIGFSYLVYSHYSNSQNLENAAAEARIEEEPWPPHFPSIEERVRYYMGSWYKHTHNNTIIPSDICKLVHLYKKPARQFDRTYIFQRDNLKSVGVRGNEYSWDALRLHFRRHMPEKLRLLMYFGDGQPYEPLPVFTKARELPDAKPPEHAHAPDPILTLMNVRYHYLRLRWSKLQERDWHHKKDTIVWRGINTGSTRKKVVETYWNHSRHDIDIAFSKLRAGTSDIPSSHVRPGMFVYQLRKYKYLLSIEGNDVATGLKWMLYSNSVVFMAPPTHVSWAMEDKLVPYYHYVPVKPDFSDLEVQLEWARENDALCQEIARQSTQYMEALWTSKRAKLANQVIIERITLRYHELYGSMLAQC